MDPKPSHGAACAYYSDPVFELPCTCGLDALIWERDGLRIDKATLELRVRELEHDLNNARTSALLLMERIKR